MIPPPKDSAQTRFFIISAFRIFGSLLFALGLAMQNNLFPTLPEVLGTALLFVGLSTAFVVPLILARAWKSPKP